MKCPVCGRNLKSIRSIKLGFGPVCYKRKFGVTPRTRGKCKNLGAPERKISGDNLEGQISIEDYLQMLSGQ